MKKFLVVLFSLMLIISIVAMGCSSKKSSTAPEEEVPTDTPTTAVQPTDTPTVAPTATVILDDFEDGDLTTSQSTTWDTWADANGSTVVVTNETTGGGANSTSRYMHTVSDIDGSVTAWPSSMVSTLYPSGDITGTNGIRFYSKGSKDANMVFLFELLNSNISDGSNWRYTVNPTATWTLVDIPWTALQKPGWGTGDTIPDINTYLQNIKGIGFAVSAGSQNASATNQVWDIDEIEIY